MDGNGRWAHRRNLPRSLGHQAGVEPVRRTVEECIRRGIGVLTLYAFSAENWRRPKIEVRALMRLLRRTLAQETERFVRHGIRLRPIGDPGGLPDPVRRALDQATEATHHGRRLELNLAVNYGGRQEIVAAVRRLAAQVAGGARSAASLAAGDLAQQLGTDGQPDPDLLIRTGGEQRLSNFLLWQAAYAELYFTKVLWPDFGPEQLEAALASYRGRQRRFGGVRPATI